MRKESRCFKERPGTILAGSARTQHRWITYTGEGVSQAVFYAKAKITTNVDATINAMRTTQTDLQETKHASRETPHVIFI